MLTAAAIAAVAVTTAWPASPARAGGQECAGNLIFTKAIRDYQDRKVGELNIYYNPGNGNNCAETVHAGRMWNRAIETSVLLYRCAKRVPAGGYCAIDNEDKDIRGQSGNFSFYAGPVRLNAENRCIWAIGWVGEWYVETRRNTEGAFCG